MLGIYVIGIVVGFFLFGELGVWFDYWNLFVILMVMFVVIFVLVVFVLIMEVLIGLWFC